MQNAARTASFAKPRALRLAGVVAACALTWQFGAPIHLLVNPVMSCCVKPHDGKKCPCRYCTHGRSAAPLLERCSDDNEHPDFSVLGLDVFQPIAVAPALPRTSSPSPAPAAPRRVPERALEVPTPPA